MALNTIDPNILSTIPVNPISYVSALKPVTTPTVSNGVANYVYNGGIVQTDLNKLYGGTLAVTPAASSSIWDTIAKNIGGVTSLASQAVSAFSAVKTQVVNTSSPSGAGAVPVSQSTPQAAPTVNISTPAINAQGSQSTTQDNTLLWIGGGAVVLILIVVLMGRK